VIIFCDSFWIGRLYDALNPVYPHLGSQAILDLTGFQSAARALRIINEWVRSICYGLHPTRVADKFLTSFIKAANLCFSPPTVDGAAYMSWQPFMPDTNIPQHYLREPGATNVMKDLFEALKGSSPFCLPAGVLFLK